MGINVVKKGAVDLSRKTGRGVRLASNLIVSNCSDSGSAHYSLEQFLCSLGFRLYGPMQWPASRSFKLGCDRRPNFRLHYVQPITVVIVTSIDDKVDLIPRPDV